MWTPKPYRQLPRTRAGAVAALMCITLAPSAAMAAGETIIVNTVEDIVDFGGLQQVADLPGPGGTISMREATTAANNTPGPQTITFAIPASEFWLIPQIALLKNEGTAFFLTDNGTTIDFSTQTAFTGDTNPNGNEVGIYGLHPSFLGVPGIWITGNDCVIKGLDRVLQRSDGVRIQGNNNRVIASTISGPLGADVYITGGFGAPPATGNIVGGTGPGEGNTLVGASTGVRIDGPAAGNTVIGNILSGTSSGAQIVSATCCPGLEAVNNRIGGPTPAERNIISGSGLYGEEGFPSGTQVSIEYATGTVVEGNYIGTTPDGMAAASPQIGPGGVSMVHAPGTVVRGNLISGIRAIGVSHYAGQLFGTAVSVSGGSAGTTIQNNRVGVKADGVSALPNVVGFSVVTFPGTPAPSAITLGGTDAGQGNLIAFSEQQGVRLSPVVNGIRLLGNSIRSSGELGIDLMAFGSTATALGVTPNDLGDADMDGANRFQNFPVIASASSTASATTVHGTLNSVASESFRVEFFQNAACDPSGFGEGAGFLGFTNVTTDASGNATIAAALGAAVPAGSFLTSTATRLSTGDTSEFSACVAVTGGGSPADFNGDGHVTGLDLALLLATWGSCPTKGPCPADLDGNGIVNGLDLGLLLGQWG